MGRLDARVAHITGAASGIGAACVDRFVAEGATVIGTDIQEPLTDFSGERFQLLDVRDEQAQQAVVDRIVGDHGRLDIVVTAAGVAVGGPVHLLDSSEWQRCQDINVTGTMYSAKVALPTMLAQKSGAIVTVASVEGIEGCEGGSAYNASKGAVILLTKNLACDYGRAGIRVNALCPGFVDTPLLRGTLPDGDFKDAITEQHKLGRLGRPDELAAAALFLASDDASFVSGVALPVDGGYTAGHAYGLAQAFAQM
ncbi:MAG: SDR family oxidoreductase [Acidimicrobiia bacterium]|nr:SDR family oxidoreductase [Acidimicrobiia bacterium]MDH5236687.1 SDR family oxidoreductase [Acidimicrobiia bacterium]